MERRNYLAETGNIKEVSHWKVKQKCLFSKGFRNAVNNSNEFKLFEKGDEPTRCNQDVISVNIKIIDLTGAVCDLDLDSDTKLVFKSSISTKDCYGNDIKHA